MNILRSSILALALAASMAVTSCSEDTAAPPPPRYAPITVFNGVVDLIGNEISFKIGETTVAANITYGVPTSAPQALVGTSTEVKALSSGGTEIGKATVNIDTNRSVWVIASGLALAQQSAVFGVSTAKPAIPAGTAVIRAIHASSNAPKLDVRQSNSLGSKLATGITYKSAGDFASVDTTVKVISITRNDNGAELLRLDVNPGFVAGKVYNLIIFGSTAVDSTAAGRLQAKIVVEP